MQPYYVTSPEIRRLRISIEKDKIVEINNDEDDDIIPPIRLLANYPAQTYCAYGSTTDSQDLQCQNWGETNINPDDFS